MQSTQTLLALQETSLTMKESSLAMQETIIQEIKDMVLLPTSISCYDPDLFNLAVETARPTKQGHATASLTSVMV